MLEDKIYELVSEIIFGELYFVVCKELLALFVRKVVIILFLANCLIEGVVLDVFHKVL